MLSAMSATQRGPNNMSGTSFIPIPMWYINVYIKVTSLWAPIIPLGSRIWEQSSLQSAKAARKKYGALLKGEWEAAVYADVQQPAVNQGALSSSIHQTHNYKIKTLFVAHSNQSSAYIFLRGLFGKPATALRGFKIKMNLYSPLPPFQALRCCSAPHWLLSSDVPFVAHVTMKPISVLRGRIPYMQALTAHSHKSDEWDVTEGRPAGNV